RSYSSYVPRTLRVVLVYCCSSPSSHDFVLACITSCACSFFFFKQKTAYEISPFGVRVVCLRTLANTDSRSIQDTMYLLADKLNLTKDQAMAQIAQSNFLKVPATVQDTANAPVLIASDRARMLTGTVVNATTGAALDETAVC